MENQFKTLPRGLEVLITKAAVDPAFKALLLDHRAEAASTIDLILTSVESAMLAAIPRGQLESIIDQTEVPAETRRVFLGKAAAAMLVALGLGATQGCRSFSRTQPSMGVQPDYPPSPSRGISPDLPFNSPVKDILFDTDKAVIRSDQLAILDRNLRFFKENSELKFIIEGHCDERGTAEYNFLLGQRRAEAVRDYLAKNGIAADRMATLSKGEEAPLDPGHTEQARARNRRVRFMRMV